MGDRKMEEPKIVREALELLREFGFRANALDDHLYHNARNLVRLNNELYDEKNK